MTIVSLKPETGGKNDSEDSGINRIELSDGSLFSFRNCYLPVEVNSTSFAEGNEINAVQEKGFRFASECLRAEKAALRLIKRAEQCARGLNRKLERRSHDTAYIDAVIARLCSLNLINDRRYSQLWVESRLGVSGSPRRMLSSLCGRGINREDAQSAMNTALNDELELSMLTRFIKRHSRKLKKKNEPAYSLKYKLKNEGFSLHVINRFLENE